MTKIDLNSETWLQIQNWARTSLVKARYKLEAPIIGHDESQFLRGKIAAITELLELPAIIKPPTIPTVDYQP